jgi:Ca2+-binding RTX toxin-like protein
LNALNTYPTQIPVQGGDVIGIWFFNNGNALAGRAAAGYALHYATGDIPPGSTAVFTPFAATQLDVSATVETTPCGGDAPTMAGTAGNDTLIGTSGPDVIVGLGGQDTLKGTGGKDRICGGDGKDTLSGGKGNDKLLGQKGADTLGGGGGNDSCKGGKGDDTLKSC